MAVVVPLGVLFREAGEGIIRQKLVEENFVDAVIELPSKLFVETRLPVAILILKKQRNHRNILFLDAKQASTEGKVHNILGDKDVVEIATTFAGFNVVHGTSYVASYDEVASNNYNLNVGRYLGSTDFQETIDFESLEGERAGLLVRLGALEKKISGKMKLLKSA